MRKFICAAVVTAIAISVATAEEYRGRVIKIEDGKVTFEKFKKGEKGKGFPKGEEVTLLLSDKAKFSKVKVTFEDGKFTEGEPTDLKLEDVTEMLAKKGKGGKGKGKGKGRGGRFARITTEGEGVKETVTAIRFTEGKGGKKKKKKTDDTE